MGYDIFSLLPDRKAAEAHAKKHRSMWINEDGSYDEKAPETLYFRLNIWGMPMLREFHDSIGFDSVNENLMDNSGNVIKDYECREIAEKIAGTSDQTILEIMTEIIKANPYSSDKSKIDPSEEARYWLAIVREWQDFLFGCAKLKGCEVL